MEERLERIKDNMLIVGLDFDQIVGAIIAEA